MLFDPGHTVIDATIVSHDGLFYMLYKDERGANRQGTDYKAICVATSSVVYGPYTPRVELVTPALTEGPAVFRVNSRWLMLYDCFMESRWGAAISEDLLDWEPIMDVKMPPGARHGTVIPITTEQWERLISAWG